jgi:hypothetical protein
MPVRRRTLLALTLLLSYAAAALPVCLVQPPELASGVGHAVESDPHAHHHHAEADAAEAPVAAPVCLCGCKGWLRAAPSAGISFVSLLSAGASLEIPILVARLAEDRTASPPSAPLDPPEHVPIAA